MDSNFVFLNVEDMNFLEVPTLLLQWGFSELTDDFAEKGIDYEALKLLTIQDVNELIPASKFGLRLKFRQKLLQWREEIGIRAPLAETILIQSSSIRDWATVTTETGDYISGRTSSQSCKNLNLLGLLNASATGKNLLEYFSKNKTLTKAHRNTLTKVICEFWIGESYQPNSNDYIEAANQIQKAFETEVEDIYLGSKTKRGKLTQTFYSLTKKFKNSGLVKCRENLKRISEVTVDEVRQTSLLEEEYTEDIEWLKNNNSPEVIIIEKWNNTFEYRRNQLKKDIDILKNWPILKQQIGKSLIEIDFNKLYAGKNGLLFSKWNDFAQKILSIYEVEIKDPKNKELLKDLINTKNEDYKRYLTIILLNAILVPQIIHEGTRKTGRVWKPSILDGQNALACHVEDLKNMPSLIENRKEKSSDNLCCIQPFIVLVGESPEIPKQIYIFFNDILYKAENFLKAVSVTFQMHYVLNIQYAKECIQVWNFIQEYFYDMPTQDNIKSSALIALLNQLK